MGVNTTTLIAYATSSITYSWDTLRGLLYDAGGLNLFIVITIISGIVGLAIILVKKIFS